MPLDTLVSWAYRSLFLLVYASLALINSRSTLFVLWFAPLLMLYPVVHNALLGLLYFLGIKLYNSIVKILFTAVGGALGLYLFHYHIKHMINEK